MTVSTRVVKLFLGQQEGRAYVPLDNGLRLQILPDISFLPQCQKHHFAAFIQDSALLIVWDDNAADLLKRTKGIEDQLMSMVWNSETDNDDSSGAAPGGRPQKPRASVHIREFTNNPDGLDEKMLEPPRRIVFIQSILTALTLILVVTAIGNGVRRMVVEIEVDHNYLRLALLVVAPLQIWLALVCPQRRQAFTILADRFSVLHAVFSNRICSNYWSNQPDERKHKILLWNSASSPLRGSPASRHNSVSSL